MSCSSTISYTLHHSINHSSTPFFPSQVAVAAKDQVPDFTPPLPTPAVFAKGNDFKEWLLTKILNAESQCHKAPDFRRLAVCTLYHYIM